MSAPEAARAALREVGTIPRDKDGPVFPTPWAARAFALTVALNERGVFSWPEWSETLGRQVGALSPDDSAEPEAYWWAWLAALEEILSAKGVAGSGDLAVLQEAWRQAAEATPHGQQIELDRQA